jgi:nucleoside-diphosphate-sugar epimerase
VSDVAIVGGGFLGGAVAAALPPPVLVVTRSGRLRTGGAPPGVTVVALDVLRSPPETIAAALAPARALVISLAPGRDQDRRELYVEGTRRVLQATRTIAWRRIVHVSSTSAIADRDGWVDETSDAPPSSERGLVQRDAEAVVREHAEAREIRPGGTRGTIPWLVLRLGGLYGPARPIGQFHRRRGNAPLPGDGNVATNLVHVDDAVQAVLAALAAAPGVRGIVHVCSDDHTCSRTLYARFGADVRWAEPRTPGAPARGKRVSNLRLKTLLGVRLLHPTAR